MDGHALLNYLILRTGCKYVSVDIPMPIESEDQIVELFVQKMESEGDIDFAIIGNFLNPPIKFTLKQKFGNCNSLKMTSKTTFRPPLPWFFRSKDWLRNAESEILLFVLTELMHLVKSISISMI